MELLRFGSLLEAYFLERKNRFTVLARTERGIIRAHLSDSGRLKELLVPDARLLLRRKNTGKFPFEVIAVWREGYGWVLLAPKYHSTVVERIIGAGLLPEFRDAIGYAREVRINGERVDFVLVYHGMALPLEVKGCTLFEGDTCLFPDAPTERGRRHVKLLGEKRRAALLFLIGNEKPLYVSLNDRSDERFASLTISALRSGVHVTAVAVRLESGGIRFAGRRVFVYPPDGETKLVAQAALEAARAFSDTFSPEARADVSTVWWDGPLFVRTLFWGYMCVSCGLYDYFYDFAAEAEKRGLYLKPIHYEMLGNTAVVTFVLDRFLR